MYKIVLIQKLDVSFKIIIVSTSITGVLMAITASFLSEAAELHVFHPITLDY